MGSDSAVGDSGPASLQLFEHEFIHEAVGCACKAKCQCASRWCCKKANNMLNTKAGITSKGISGEALRNIERQAAAKAKTTLAKVQTDLTKALAKAKTQGSQVAKLSAQLKSAPKASSATEKALQKKLALEEKKAATLQQKLVQQAQGLKRDMSAKDDLLKKQSSKLKVAGTLQDELKQAQAKIATLSKPAPALKVSGAMKKMVNNLKKTASEEHTQALDAVEKAKRFAAQVAADPHSTIKDITSAQKGIDDAQRTFAKARVAEAKAHGAKQLLHQAKAK